MSQPFLRVWAQGALFSFALLALPLSAAPPAKVPPPGSPPLASAEAFDDSVDQPKERYKPKEDKDEAVRYMSPEFDQAIIKSALKDLNPRLMEKPPGSNTDRKGPIDKYLKDCGVSAPAFWCAAFVSHHVRAGGDKVRHLLPEGIKWRAYFANCNDIHKWAKKWNLVVTDKTKVHPGCIFLIPRTSGPNRGTYRHTGIVRRVLPGGWVTTIEGNATTVKNGPGIGVYELTRPISALVIIEAA